MENEMVEIEAILRKAADTARIPEGTKALLRNAAREIEHLRDEVQTHTALSAKCIARDDELRRRVAEAEERAARAEERTPLSAADISLATTDDLLSVLRARHDGHLFVGVRHTKPNEEDTYVNFSRGRVQAIGMAEVARRRLHAQRESSSVEYEDEP